MPFVSCVEVEMTLGHQTSEVLVSIFAYSVAILIQTYCKLSLATLFELRTETAAFDIVSVYMYAHVCTYTCMCTCA